MKPGTMLTHPEKGKKKIGKWVCAWGFAEKKSFGEFHLIGDIRTFLAVSSKKKVFDPNRSFSSSKVAGNGSLHHNFVTPHLTIGGT